MKLGTLDAMGSDPTSTTSPPEAAAADLRRRCDPASLGFETTAEVEPSDAPAGQEPAEQALRLAAELDGGFNAVVTGPPGTGRRAAVLAWLSERARREPAPPDLVYVPNFTDAMRPRALDVPAGTGDRLAEDVATLVADATQRLQEAFESEGFRTRHRELHDEVDRRRRELLGRLEARANELGVGLQLTPAGVVMVPIVAKRPLTPEEIQNMPPEARSRFEAAVEELRDPSEEAFAQLRELDRETAARHRELRRDVALTAVSDLVDQVRARWPESPAVTAWLDDVREDIVANLDAFLPQPEMPAPVAALAARGRPDPAQRYAVNVLVRSDPDGGAPIVSPQDTSFAGLFGRIEYETTLGAVTTDHRHLRGGAVHEARGGYLVLDARDVLGTPLAWMRLKELLRSGTIRIENPGAQYTVFPGVTPQPEPVPANVVVVLIATPDLHALMHAADEDMARLFKVHVAFDDEMPRTPEAERGYAALVSRMAADGATPHFDAGAVAALIEHGSRVAGNQERLTTRRRALVEVIREAGHRARSDQRDTVTAADVRDALAARHDRSALAERRLRSAILDETIRIDLDGEVVGQVNGLAVRSAGPIAFGHPVRITATAAPGEGHVVDIEREAELSGPLHAKGVLILTGFLAGRYCADSPLALRASVVFEQSYGPVEGDSASAAELIALLSVLSGAPVRQGVAITGSIDQHGRIQAIGGVDEKVEGFFALCRERGLTGDQGVVVPATNLRHAMLAPEVVEAVEAGRFHVWPVRTIDEALAILTGRVAGTRGDDGSWTPGSLNEAVQKRIQAMSSAARRSAGRPKRRRPDAEAPE
ncbi:MAG TPA: AAA family ATPase [Capillimicrobium sp.]|nr:AAA family ATPase [Capillimicrobium sp.]